MSRTPRQTPLLPAENASSSLVPDTRTATTNLSRSTSISYSIVEIDADERIGAVVIFDLEDFDAAIAELDARYLAGEAAAHSRTWSVIMQGYAALNRRELPPTTPDWVNIDHRRGTSIAPGGIPELLTAAWNVTSDLNNFVEAVHRLDNLGGVVTHVANETSQEGFHAEWRVVSVFTVEGDLVNRCEVFDEAAIDAAIARFEELSRPAPRLENAASQAQRALHCVLQRRATGTPCARFWPTTFSSDDRRRVMSAGIRHGRDAEIAEHAGGRRLGVRTLRSTSSRPAGSRLVLTRTRSAGRDQRAEAFLRRGARRRRDRRRRPHRDRSSCSTSRTSRPPSRNSTPGTSPAKRPPTRARGRSISGSYAAINRHELPLTTPDCVNIDRRREIAMGVGDLIAYIGAGPGPGSRLQGLCRGRA